MKLILNRYHSSVNELSLELDKKGWDRIVKLVEELQDEGECVDVDTSSKQSFVDSLLGDENAIGILFERMLENQVGEEHCYIDPTNESYQASIES